jgi:hypothetical protein
MKVGMLWFDEDQTSSLQVRIDRAVEYYQRKYGARPDLCMVHPRTLEQDGTAGDGKMRVRSSSAVLPNHFWLGIDDQGLQAA